MWPFSSSNTAIVEAKRAERSKALKDVPKDVDPTHSVFLKATATEIVARIEQGEWTATQVLEAYIARAAYAHAKTNCLTEVMLGPARERAVELDAHFTATKKLRGPLHGVPISIKEQFEITGYDTSVGFSQWANNPAQSNADIVNTLLAAGAIIYVKTNIPQTMFAFECSNPVWGRTTNPWNENYTCGGSSGGEAALLAMDGSAAGIGTDIGGSLRIPAAYCGIYSLKPASGRVSYFGAKGPVPGSEGIVTVAGPMGRSVEDLELISRVTFGVPSSDYLVPPLPFREVAMPKKLKFGYYTSDNYIKASPACKRAVLETVEALRNAGHECVEFEVPDAHVPFNLFAAIVSADGYKTMLSHLGPDPKESALFLATLGPSIPGFIRNFAAWVIEKFVGDTLFASTVRSSRKKEVFETYQLIKAKNEYRNRFYNDVWSRYEFDSIIAPVQALPQLPHGGCNNFSTLAEATIIYNVLDMPAGCLPVTRVDPAKDHLTDEWLTGPGLGSRVIEGGIYRGTKPLYDPEALRGMPVNVQLVGKKWEEEKVLAIMKVVDDALGKERGFGPGAWDAYVGVKA
ncbi:amidase [Pholiota conissans]|uniref:amidase n=1 Tax=Pholiota conissans TaxID=109636 RepID=A0A9P6D6D1_9AGAR|nr:amidase [Pholiota conissans]